MAHIVGAVHQPGVVALPEGSRVFEYVDAAGGLRDDAAPESVNFAAVVHDGEQIVIAHREETNGSPSLATSARSGPPEVSSPQRGKVNLNTADLEQLDALPRIGKVLAQRIIDWRKEHRRFSSIEQLRSVDGIGSKLLETLRSWVTV